MITVIGLLFIYLVFACFDHGHWPGTPVGSGHCHGRSMACVGVILHSRGRNEVHDTVLIDGHLIACAGSLLLRSICRDVVHCSIFAFELWLGA